MYLREEIKMLPKLIQKTVDNFLLPKINVDDIIDFLPTLLIAQSCRLTRFLN